MAIIFVSPSTLMGTIHGNAVRSDYAIKGQIH
jgi:hypothetical protein